MSSSDGSSNSLGAFLASQPASPMPGLPVAGQGGGVGDPFEFGKFQSFLPDAKASGPNDSATGLRPDMFVYKSPHGVADPGNTGNQIQDLRNQLASLQQNQQSQQPNQFGAAQGANGHNPQDMSRAQYDAFMQTQLPPSTFYGSG